MPISNATYKLYRQHGSECEWLWDPKSTRPKGTNPQTDEAFYVLEQLEENLELFHNPHYSNAMKDEFEEIIAQLRHKLDEDVFRLLEAKAKGVPSETD